jgi:hypothetical protein
MVSHHRASRAAGAMALLSAMALVFAACGRDITDNAPSTRGSVRMSTKAFQTTSTGGSGGDVTFVRVVISAVAASATAGGSASARVITNVVIEADTVGNGSSGNETDSTAGSVTIGFPIQGAGVTYQVTLAAADQAGDTTYRGGPATFTSADVSAAGAVTVSLQANYVGPGANAVRVVASPRTINLVANSGNGQGQFSATAYDAAGNVLPQALLEWTSADTTIANVDGNLGTVFANGKRGSTTITVTAQGAARPTDAVTVNVSLPAQAIVLVSGGGQSGPIGKPLLNPIVVKAVASDGVPVAGTTINFQAQGSGTAVPASAVTNSSGVAQTTWTLGTVVGNQNMSVSIPNSPASTTVSATGIGTTGGTTGAMTLTLLSNNTISQQHGTVVTGVTVLAQINGVPQTGISVTFSPGSGSVSQSTVSTDAQGHAVVNWTLGPNTGTQTLNISAPGATNSITLSVNATAAAAGRAP